MVRYSDCKVHSSIDIDFIRMPETLYIVIILFLTKKIFPYIFF